MKRVALINDENIITNVAVWDGASQWSPEGYELVDVTKNNKSRIGDTAPVEDFLERGIVSDGLIWFDATDFTTMTLNGTRIDEWRDKLGSEHKLVTPVAGTFWNLSWDASLFSGRGGILLTEGCRKYLESSSSFSLNWSTGWTILAVIKRTSRNGFFYVQDQAHGMVMGAGVCERAGIGTSSVSSQGIPRNHTCVFGTVFTGGVGMAGYRYVVDETVNHQIAEYVLTSYTGDFGKLSVGSVGGVFDGGIGEVAAFFFYNRKLSNDEIAQQSRWAKDYYSLEELPAPTWNVVIDGNSLSYGFGARYSNALYDGSLAVNSTMTQQDVKLVAWSGSTTEMLRTRAATTVDVLYNEDILAQRRICLFWEGTNDIVLNRSLTSLQLFNRIKSYCEDRKAKGWKVILATIIPRTTTYEDFETKRLEINQYIRDAKAANAPWLDAVADIGGDEVVGATGANLNPTYYPDGVHFNELGYMYCKTYFTNAINSLI